VGELWFNGYKHLPENPKRELFGAVQGERLTAAILKHKIPWNTSFKDGAVAIPNVSGLPVIEFAEGVRVTLLSPTEKQLLSLKKNWEAEVHEANLVPGAGFTAENDRARSTRETFATQDVLDVEGLSLTRFKEDKAPANGSSIAFLLDFHGIKMLFTGDAHPGQILRSLNDLYGDRLMEDFPSWGRRQYRP
jgi:hypothetical protein